MNHSYCLTIELFNDPPAGFSFQNHITALRDLERGFNHYFRSIKNPNPKHIKIKSISQNGVEVELQTTNLLKAGKEGHAIYKFSKLASVKPPFANLISGHRLFTIH